MPRTRKSQKPELRLEETFRKLCGKKTAKRKNAGVLSILIVVLVVCLLIGGGIYLFAVLPYSSAPDGLTVAGVDISGMSLEEATEAVSKATEVYSTQDTVLKIGNKSFVLSAKDMKVQFDAESAVKAAFDSKMENGAFDITPYLTFDAAFVSSQVENIQAAFNETMQQSSYEVIGKAPADLTGVETQKIVLTLGKAGCSVDLSDLQTKLMTAYASVSFEITPTHTVSQPDPIDLPQLFAQYCKPAKDAVLNTKDMSIQTEVMGYGFDMASVGTALEAVAPGGSLDVEMTWLAPAVTEESLLATIYPDVLGSYTAIGNAFDPDRNVNLAVACQRINGIVLMPGETFSYNAALGERTIENGYRPGESYENGQTVYTIGGGICQVSSALYYCTLYADLKIVERECHGFLVPYMPKGMDAMVSWGAYDFRFRNNTDHPIRIYASAVNNSTTVKIFGTDTKSYNVKMEYEVLETIPFTTEIQYFYKNNPQGYTNGQIIVAPYTGYKVNTYKCKYDKETGELISRKYEDYSSYKKKNAVVVEIIDA